MIQHPYALNARDGHARRGSTTPLSLDHVHPYSRDGSEDPGNLQTLYRSCDSSTGTRAGVGERRRIGR